MCDARALQNVLKFIVVGLGESLHVREMERADTAATQRGSLEIQGLSVEAGGTTILSGISLEMQPGQLVALLGPSGAGKSTLMKCVLGLREPSRGQVLASGKSLDQCGPVGYVPQDDHVHKALTVWQELDYTAQLRLPTLDKSERASLINKVLKKVDLSERKNLRINKLSGGQRKRVSVALELLTSPDVLILDEPTSGLDPGLEVKMMRFFSELADGGRLVMVATHAMESVMLCDAVIMLMEGRLIFHGSPEQTLKHFGKQRFVEIFKELPNQPVSRWVQHYKGGAQHG